MCCGTLFKAGFGVGIILSAETLGKEVAEIGKLIRLRTTRGSGLGAHCVYGLEELTHTGVEAQARDRLEARLLAESWPGGRNVPVSESGRHCGLRHALFTG
jgi:hypothetical protein